MRAYKLYDTEKALFSTGGYYGGWHRHGKTWSTIAALRAHLRLRYTRPGLHGDEIVIPDTIKVIEIPVDVSSQSVALAKDIM